MSSQSPVGASKRRRRRRRRTYDGWMPSLSRRLRKR